MNKLYFGDNLDILREHIKDETVDLVYLDPPFNSNANYNVLFKTPKGHESAAQIEGLKMEDWLWKISYILAITSIFFVSILKTNRSI